MVIWENWNQIQIFKIHEKLYSLEFYYFRLSDVLKYNFNGYGYDWFPTE